MITVIGVALGFIAAAAWIFILTCVARWLVGFCSPSDPFGKHKWWQWPLWMACGMAFIFPAFVGGLIAIAYFITVWTGIAKPL